MWIIKLKISVPATKNVIYHFIVYAVITCVIDVSDTSFHDFVNHPCMCEIKDRSVFIHVDVPGHEDNAADLPAK